MKKFAFIDRDGTICEEPEDFQVDRIDKIRLLPHVICSLLSLQEMGYELVMISNQDGLGSASFPKDDFEVPHQFLMDLLSSQGINFSDVLICPHLPEENCFCRKPNLGLVVQYMQSSDWDRKASFVVGDRATDQQLGERMGLKTFLLANDSYDWNKIIEELKVSPRKADVLRQTKETKIEIGVNLDEPGKVEVQTGIGFFDHMLEQLGKHGGFSLSVKCEGDLHIDDHHTIEDIGLALGSCIAQALGDKRNIERYGFLLPMDEAQAQVALDLSGRPYFIFDARFDKEKLGDLSTEMIPHFFRSLSETLKANLHIQVKGDNDHHRAEAIFKAVARALRQAISKTSLAEGLPSTKGLL